MHVVEPGDTFSTLAEHYYGSQRHTNYLIAANRQIKDPARLAIGQELNIPPPPGSTTRVASSPRPPSGRTYVVQDGDTFYDIARKYLGSGARWPELYERNKDVVGHDPGNLKIGQVLELPPD